MSIQTTNDLSSLEIVQTVAEKTGEDALELPPLYDYIDPDALDSLLTGQQSGQIEFSYAECLVTVSFGDDQSVTVTEKKEVPVQ